MTRTIAAPARAGSSHPAVRPPSRIRAAGRAAWRFGARKPALVLGTLAVTCAAGAFGWNVLVKQTSPHPAPLFAAAKPAPVAVEPPKRPAELAAAAPTPAQQPRNEAQASPARPDASKPAGGGDAIANLLRSGEPAGRSPSETRSIPDKGGSQARVARAQKALAKLGYGPIATDGIFGSTTRQALEKFERDRKMPVTGSLGPRTAKQLAALSGLPLP